MDELIWIIIALALFIALENKDKELLKEMSKKKRDKVLKERAKIQKKNLKDLWVVLWVIVSIFALFIFWLISVYS